MRKSIRLWYGISAMALSILAAAAGPSEAEASSYEYLKGPSLTNGCTAYVTDSADIYVSMDSYDIVKTASAGESYTIVSDEGGGWMGVTNGAVTGFVSQEQVEIYTADEWSAFQQDAEVQAQIAAAASNERRQQIVNFALQFIGYPYVWGGTNPYTGADCSGFVRYIMQNAAGVWLERTSCSQACQGASVGADQIRPGDLVFYAQGGQVNHVALYIGNGQVVHASSEKSGVKISRWTYRQPVRIANVLGD